MTTQIPNASLSRELTIPEERPSPMHLPRDTPRRLQVLGANDAVRVGPEPTQTLVSLEETIRNLAELRRLVDLTTDARWIWLPRMPIDEARMAAYEPFRMGPLASVWRNPDLEAINAWIRAQPESVVDMYAAFGSPTPQELQEPDGLHPTLAGHQVLAREFVADLTE
jgi:lysophospholipase L1-like esterase